MNPNDNNNNNQTTKMKWKNIYKKMQSVMVSGKMFISESLGLFPAYVSML